MAKKIPTIWDLEPHTAKKHEILRRYFEAWFPIMAKQNRRVIYIDGFAGPGEYSGGESGSPVVVLKAAKDHSYPVTSELVCIFVEADKARHDHLVEVLNELKPNLPGNIKCYVAHGTFDEHLTRVFQLLDEQKLGLAPTFVFVDPFGFSHTPFSTIERVLANEKCEVLINFMYEEVNRFLSLEAHAADYDRLFGTPDWRRNITIGEPRERKRGIHDTYLARLKKSAKYVRSFEMLNDGNATDYFLFFATNNLLGLEKMKEAMWRVDETGSFQFSDYTDSLRRVSLFGSEPHIPHLRSLLISRFQGKQADIEIIGDWVVAETPFLRSHIKRQILKPMEEEGAIMIVNPNPKRRRGTFPDGTRISFRRSEA